MLSDTKRWSQALSLTSLALAVLAAASIASAQDQRCPDGDTKVARVDVTIDYDNGTVSVSPSSVEVYLVEGPERPSRVCWVISQLRDGDELVLVDKDASAADFFPGLKRTITSRAAFANSGNPAKAGTWDDNLEGTCWIVC